MRLHRLEISAFGPYPGQEEIDFDALGEDGLFLLHGETGAGKTTVLDAVAFALFGTVPGARGEVRRLRCDYAPPDTPTEVALELTVQGRRLRLVRSPEYERTKRRGSGTTKQNAKASLVWLDDPPDEQQAVTRIDEVGDVVAKLVGMSASQFFQVAMLPQGEFARFLRADTVEREKLLTSLFGVERFSGVEIWFREQRRERRRELDELRGDERSLVARIAQAAGEEPPEPGDDSAEWLASLRKECAEGLAADTERAERAKAASARADAALVERRALKSKMDRLLDATNELSGLDARKRERRALEKEIEAARLVRPVVQADIALRDAESAVTAAEAGVRDTERSAESMVRLSGGDTVATDIRELRTAAGDHRQRAGELAALVAEARQQDAEQRKLRELDTEAAALAETIAAHQRKLDALPERLAATRSALLDAQAAAGRLDSASTRRAELANAAEQAARLPGVRQALDAARERRSAAVDEHQAAREALQHLRQQRLDGMAAELAGRLVAGDACPVCGSAEHPAPAGAGEVSVTEADEQDASTREQQAHQHREQVVSQVNEVERELAAIHQWMNERTTEDITAQLRAATAEEQRDRAMAAKAASHAAAVTELETAGEQLRHQHGTDAQRAASVTAQHRALTDAVTQRGIRLEEARAGHPDVATRRQRMLDAAESLDAVADARATARTAVQRRDEYAATLQRAVTGAGFATVKKALAAGRDEDYISASERRLRRDEDRANAARRTLADPELFGLEAGEPIDVAAEVEAAHGTRRAAEQALSQADAARQRVADVERLARDLLARRQRIEPVLTEFTELDALTDVVNGQGQNHKKMSLRSYVLAARLEEVAVAATRRLRRMSADRYSFVHSDAKGSHGTRGGLGLDVLDDYSGQVRPAKTLSGGELFLASLSLALGLADVVAAESGGAQLDTLFVDEGFGTLDADTLEDVLDTVDELRAGGRVVGLVSHVAELRQRIPTQLRVRKARGGSTLNVLRG